MFVSTLPLYGYEWMDRHDNEYDEAVYHRSLRLTKPRRGRRGSEKSFSREGMDYVRRGEYCSAVKRLYARRLLAPVHTQAWRDAADNWSTWRTDRAWLDQYDDTYCDDDLCYDDYYDRWKEERDSWLHFRRDPDDNGPDSRPDLAWSYWDGALHSEDCYCAICDDDRDCVAEDRSRTIRDFLSGSPLDELS